MDIAVRGGHPVHKAVVRLEAFFDRTVLPPDGWLKWQKLLKRSRAKRPRIDSIVEVAIEFCDWVNSLLSDRPSAMITRSALQVETAQADVAGQSDVQSRLDPKLPTAHSLDFRSVRWFGEEYTFTKTQAACLKVMWEAWEQGTPDLDQQTILNEADADSKRLVDVFRDHRT